MTSPSCWASHLEARSEPLGIAHSWVCRPRSGTPCVASGYRAIPRSAPAPQSVRPQLAPPRLTATLGASRPARPQGPVAAAASALDLGQGWRVSLDGDTITARRRGVPGLEALAVTFSVGYLSGGGPTTLPNPIGFTAAKFTADLDAPLGNLTLRATAAGAEASGAFCESRRSAHCEVVSCASVDYWDAAAAP